MMAPFITQGFTYEYSEIGDRPQNTLFWLESFCWKGTRELNSWLDALPRTFVTGVLKHKKRAGAIVN